MIGISIRSIRHLHRVSDTSLKTVLIKFRENVWDICKVLRMPANSPFGDTIFIFNNSVRQSHWDVNTVINSKEYQKYVKENIIDRYGRLMSISPSEFSSYSNVFCEITLLPDSFDKDYEKFLKENAKMISNLTNMFGINTKDVRIKRLYIYSDGSKNFFQWAITLFWKNGISISTIRNILLWNESYKQLSKNLSKGTITAYTTRESIVALLYELSELRKEKRINDSINSFNTLQKKMFKENELSSDIKQALWRLSRLSDVKRINFIKKMSSVNDFNELTRQLKFATSVHFAWNKESFLDFLTNVEGMKYEKIYENDNIVLVKTLDYETIKQLGKTTNWCISKNKHYWNNYIENYHGQTTQYMVFDFSKIEDDKLSIIGFTTTHNRGITSAHNFINEDLMGNGANEHVLLESFIDRFNENRNIYTILGNIGVDVTLVVEYDMPSYKWDKNSLFEYLYECVNPENVETLLSKDNKIVLSVTDKNICYFFGDTYHDNIESGYYSCQHIIFIDFNKCKYDSNKIQFAIIEEGCGDEDYCIGVYNERSLNTGGNFDSLLIEFGLPYNTIRRTNNPLVRLRNALSSYNTPIIKDCMKDCSKDDLKLIITKEIGYESYYDMLTRTVDNYMSFDYLNILYDNSLTLNDFMPIEYIGDIVKHFAGNMKNISRSTNNFMNLEGVTDAEIADFYALKIDRREDAKYIGYYLIIKAIIENEKLDKMEFSRLFRKFFAFMSNTNKETEVFEQIVNLVKDKLDYSNKSDSNSYLIKYTVYYGSNELKEYMNKIASENKAINDLMVRNTAEYDKIKANSNKFASVYAQIHEAVTLPTDFLF